MEYVEVIVVVFQRGRFFRNKDMEGKGKNEMDGRSCKKGGLDGIEMEEGSNLVCELEGISETMTNETGGLGEYCKHECRGPIYTVRFVTRDTYF